jgi:hypothetical protein
MSRNEAYVRTMSRRSRACLRTVIVKMTRENKHSRAMERRFIFTSQCEDEAVEYATTSHGNTSSHLWLCKMMLEAATNAHLTCPASHCDGAWKRQALADCYRSKEAIAMTHAFTHLAGGRSSIVSTTCLMTSPHSKSDPLPDCSGSEEHNRQADDLNPFLRACIVNTILPAEPSIWT